MVNHNSEKSLMKCVRNETTRVAQKIAKWHNHHKLNGAIMDLTVEIKS